jgi:hypothetical protein
MRGPLLLLLVSVICVEGLNAEELPCQASKPAADKKVGRKPKYSCFCPLFPVAPEFWYGEYHPDQSNCLTPEAVYFDSEQTTQICAPPDCGCLAKRAPSVCSKNHYILQRPVEYTLFPRECISDDQIRFPYEHAKDCTFSDPRFVTFELPNRTVTAKIFAVTVDVEKRGKGKPVNHIRKNRHLAFLGFECETPSGITPKQISIKKHCNGHVVVDLVLHEGIILIVE